jgi:ankyrin repeat protein
MKSFKLGFEFQSSKDKAAATAAFNGDFDAAFAAVERGANINSCRFIGDVDNGGGEGNIGYSAVKHGNMDALKKALELGLDPSLKSPYRQPLVAFAISNKQEAMASLLIEKGADVSSYLIGDFFSPLALARIHGMPELEKQIAATLTPEKLAEARSNDIPNFAAPKPADKPGFKV